MMHVNSDEYDDFSLEGDPNRSGNKILVENKMQDFERGHNSLSDKEIKQMIENYSLSDNDLSDGSYEEADENLPQRESRDFQDQLDGIVIRDGLQQSGVGSLLEAQKHTHFPQVNAPSLELSRNNSPRGSIGFKDKVGGQEAVLKYERNVSKGSPNPSSLFGPPTVPDQLRLTARKVFDSFSSKLTEKLRKDVTHLSEALGAKDDQIREIMDKCAQLEDTLGLGKASSEEELEIIRGRLLQKSAKENSSLKKELKSQEKNLQEALLHLRTLETEYESLKESMDEEIEKLVEEGEKYKALASGYKSREFELEGEMERAKKELLHMKKKLEDSYFSLENKEKELNKLRLFLEEAENRNHQLESVLASRDQEIESLNQDNNKLKTLLEEYSLNNNRAEQKKTSKEEREPSLLQGDERMQYEWQIGELKKQIITLKNGQNGLLRPKSRSNEVDFDVDNERKSFEPPHNQSQISREHRTPSTTSVSDKSEQVKSLDDMFKQVLEISLHQMCAIDDHSEYTIGELSGMLPKCAGKLYQNYETLYHQNQVLIKECESLQAALNEAQTSHHPAKESHPLALPAQITFKGNDDVAKLEQKLKVREDELGKEIKSLQADNQNLKDSLYQQRAETSRLNTLLQQRAAKTPPPPKEITQVIFTQPPAQERPSTQDFSIQHGQEEENISKVRMLEKTLKEVKHDASIKAKLTKELEARCSQLEEESKRLMASMDEEQLSKKKVEALEKKISMLNQDLANKDKKNLELYENIKKLKSESESVMTSTAKFGETKQLTTAKHCSKRTQSTQRKTSGRLSKEDVQDVELMAVSLQRDLKDTKDEMAELYKKVFNELPRLTNSTLKRAFCTRLLTSN